MTVDVAFSLAVLPGAPGMEGEVSRIAARWTIRARYFGDGTMTLSESIQLEMYTLHQQVVENLIIDYIAIPLHQGVIMGYIAQFSVPPRRVTISYSRL